MRNKVVKIFAMLLVVVLLGCVVSETAYAATKNASASGRTELLTEKQRKKSYKSSTNPERGQKVTTVARPPMNGFIYADFSTFNNYNSETKLGGTPIYLLGTVMDVVAFAENNGMYEVAIMINDCDGYQWYGRANVAKQYFDMFKTTYMGQVEYFYGISSGYSGVMNRPMIDIMITISATGVANNLAIYAIPQQVPVATQTPATNTQATQTSQTTTATASNSQTTTTNSNSRVSNNNAQATESVAQSTAIDNKSTNTVEQTSNSDSLVWVSRSGNYYHKSSSCSELGSEKAAQMSETEAKKLFVKCTKCW